MTARQWAQYLRFATHRLMWREKYRVWTWWR